MIAEPPMPQHFYTSTEVPLPPLRFPKVYLARLANYSQFHTTFYSNGKVKMVNLKTARITPAYYYTEILNSNSKVTRLLKHLNFTEFKEGRFCKWQLAIPEENLYEIESLAKKINFEAVKEYINNQYDDFIDQENYNSLTEKGKIEVIKEFVHKIKAIDFNTIKETFQTYGSKEGQCRIL